MKKEDRKGQSGQGRSPRHQDQSTGKVSKLPRVDTVPRTFIYPKLQVGSANDPAEREADLAAEQVMRGGKVHTEGARSVTTGQGNDQPGALCMKANSAASGGMAAPAAVESKINSKRGKGGSLPKPIQQKLSHTFGTDFSGVRVHNDSSSHDMNAQLRAKAFAQGSDMFFGHGQYAPGTAEGDRLIAHEAAHVVQGGANERKVRRKEMGGSSDNTPDPESPIKGQVRIKYSHIEGCSPKVVDINLAGNTPLELECNSKGIITLNWTSNTYKGSQSGSASWTFIAGGNTDMISIMPAYESTSLSRDQFSSITNCELIPPRNGWGNQIIMKLYVEGIQSAFAKQTIDAYTYGKSDSDAKTTSWSNSVKVGHTQGGKVSASIPDVGGVEGSSSFTFEDTYTNGGAETKTTTYNASQTQTESNGITVNAPRQRWSLVYTGTFKGINGKLANTTTYFKTGSAELTTVGKEIILQRIAMLRPEEHMALSEGKSYLMINGFADERGGSIMNYQLSEARARSVKNFILENSDALKTYQDYRQGRAIISSGKGEIPGAGGGGDDNLTPAGWDAPTNRKTILFVYPEVPVDYARHSNQH